MVDVSLSQALNAYQNAQRVAGNSVSTTAAGNAISGTTEAQNALNPGFWQVLDKNINQALDAQYRGEAAGIASLSNKVSPTDLAVAINNAELTLRTITAIRDRVITAYQDIIKMPV